MGTEIENLQKLLQKDASNFQARRELAILLAENGFNEEALSNLKFLEKYFPEDAELHYNIGILHEKTHNFEQARTSYESAIAISPQEDFYYNLGEVLIELKEWDLAINAFKTVLKSDTNDGNCYFNLGLCYYKKDEINLATDYFQKAVILNPQDIYAHFYLGNIYQDSSLTNFAVESYNKVLSISPDYSWAYYNLACISFKNGNFEEAKEKLEQTIHYNDMDIDAYELLTKVCLKQGEAEDIITILSSRLQKEENGSLYYMLARVYKFTGQTIEYHNCLNKALQNHLTLKYTKDVVKQELEYTEYQINLQEPSKTEFEYKEYNPSDNKNDNSWEEDEDATINEEDDFEYDDKEEEEEE